MADDGAGASGEIILSTAPDGAQVQLRTVYGTVWLNQARIADLYDTSVPNIAQIIRRILADGEVTEATINSELSLDPPTLLCVEVSQVF